MEGKRNLLFAFSLSIITACHVTILLLNDLKNLSASMCVVF